ncbi:MAG: Stk1 family PASTA domain-containing Ser/Thr kinase [Faecalimonas sp.]|nr:Stk1 family PASTA domain-containing Ser/Thr kinase [Faecalimonas sp.]
MIKAGAIIGGRYEIMGCIGTGGMADVYKAVDQKLNRYVAIKVLKREYREDENFVKKFQTEAQSAAGLLHPNIVNVYDVAEDRGLYYIVMEFVDGITLKEYIQKKGSLTPKEVISIAVQVCAAMELAHSNNLIHRDIKPQNIMISKEGKVKVTDFGIAKATSSNTISTNMMGSVHYTSPEQARGGYSDAKSDIYSLGITMYEMITGVLPFEGESTVSIALQHLQDDMPLPSDLVPDMPYSLEQIVLKCTQKSPDRRYADITQLAKDLRRSLADPDGDFVVITPLITSTDTRKITEEELRQIQRAAGYEGDDDVYGEYDEDEYEARRARRQEANSKKDIDPKMAKIMKILTIVVSVIFVFILGAVLLNATGLLKFGAGGSVSSEAKVSVPKLVGLKLEEAEAACEEVGLRLKVVSEVESKKYEKNYVEKQKSQEGAKMPEGAIVQVVISKGKLLEIPDLEEKEYIDARDILMEMGFAKSKIKLVEEPHDKIPEDKVIRTEPAAGEWKTKETTITVYVSTGIEMVDVPNLIGLKKEDAEESLKAKGLVGNVTEKYSTAEVGRVIEQSEDAGDQIAKGSTVEYVISKGEEPKEQVTIPNNLTEKSYYDVKARLENMGLVVKKISEKSYEYEEDMVIAVPKSGETVEVGTTVEVHVSIGPGPSGAPGGPGAGTGTGTGTGAGTGGTQN